MKYFVHKLPIHHSSMTRWRQRVGEAGVEKLLKETIKTGLKLKIIKSSQLEDINIDTTVQEKFIRLPTDSRLYYRAIQRLAKSAKKFNVILIEDYAKLSEHLRYQQSRYMHTEKEDKVKEYSFELRRCLGKIVRDFQNSKLVFNNKTRKEILIARSIYFQEKKSKNKIYSFHAPEAECIAKGKLHKEFEFGNKVSIAATNSGGWLVGALAFHGNPYDGHTLRKSLWQIYRFIKIPKRAFVDMGFRGHNYLGKVKVYIKKWSKGSLPDKLWAKLKRRVAIEPTIGHLKNTYRMNHNKLKGKLGDCINVILSAAGMNFRKLLKAVFFLYIFLFQLVIKLSNQKKNLCSKTYCF